MKEETNIEKFNSDIEILKDLYSNLGDLIDSCMINKEIINDMESWEVVHDIEFQLGLSREELSRYLRRIDIDPDEVIDEDI